MAQKTSNNRKSTSGSQQRGRRNPSSKGASDAGILTSRVKQDISAICLIVVSIALFVMVSMPGDAVVSSAVSNALKLAFGQGATLLPVFILAIGLSLLLRTGESSLPARLTIGLSIIFVAILGILSVNSFGATSGSVEFLFTNSILTSYGGYVGSAIAWVGITLFGRTVTMIVLIGLIAIGLAFIGFSVSRIISAISGRKTTKSLQGNSGQKDNSLIGAIKRIRDRNDPDNTVKNFDDGLKTDETQVLNPANPNAKNKRGKGKTDDSGDDFSNQQTMLVGSDSNPKRKGKGVSVKKRNTRLDAADTIALTDDSRPISRKLGDVKAPVKTSASKVKKTPKISSAMPSPDENFMLPTMDMLTQSNRKNRVRVSDSELGATADVLQQTLSDFGINADVVGWVAGPTVTLFKICLPNGVRVNRVTALNNDIALALAAPGVRIFAPIPGTNYVGIEVPNQTREVVLLSDVLDSAPPGPLQVAIGEDVEGNKIVSDLSKMPHLLIGGTTGSGKSVSINAMIMSILMRATPAEVRLIMIDPKRVEFTPYNGIPHLYVPVVTEPKEAASALSWGVAEMERRLKVFSQVGARNISQYNAHAQGSAGEDEALEELPYIVIIIDELADLMMNVGKEVEFSISRIAQLARAAGIHLIVATQRPSTKVVTGLIKANITNRISFNVASGIDSRVILDSTGAENLIGNGDLLLSKPELARPQRIQGCFVSEDEINTVVEHLKTQGTPEYHDEILKTNLISLGDTNPDGTGGTASGNDDPLIWEAAEIVVSSGLGSTSNLQRRLKVGYSRAGRIMDMLEEKGVVGAPNGSKPREVLVDAMELETLKAFEQNDE